MEREAVVTGKYRVVKNCHQLIYWCLIVVENEAGYRKRTDPFPGRFFDGIDLRRRKTIYFIWCAKLLSSMFLEMNSYISKAWL